MASQVIVPSDIVANAKNYMTDITAEQYGKRVMDKDILATATKLRYLLKALTMNDIEEESKSRIYQALLCLVPYYNVDTVSVLS